MPKHIGVRNVNTSGKKRRSRPKDMLPSPDNRRARKRQVRGKKSAMVVNLPERGVPVPGVGQRKNQSTD